MSSSPAGWYPDPQQPSRRRYWDGMRWTDAYDPPVAPAAPPPAAPPVAPARKEATAPAPPTAASREAARNGPLRRIDPAIVALTILAFGVASYHLGAKSLWLDEAASVDFTNSLARLGDIVSGGDPNMGLYHGLLYFWRELFGSDEVALRSLTVLLGGLTVPVMVLLGTELFGRAAGLVSGLLLALSPFFLEYEQTARSYALVVLLVVLSSYFFVRELERTSRATRVGFVLASALAIYAQYFAALVLLAQLLTLLATERRAALTRKWLVDAGAIALLCAPAVVFALRKGTGGIDWIPEPSLSDLIDLPSELAGGKVLLIALLILACYGFSRAIEDQLLRPAGFVATWFLVPLLLVFAVSVLGRPLFISYYLIIIVPALLLLASAGLVRLPGRASGIVALGLLIAASAVGISDWYERPSREDYRSATRYILEHQRPDDRIIYHPFYIPHAFDYYEAQAGTSLPSEVEPGAHPPRIWLAARFAAPPQQLSQSLADAYESETSQTFAGGPSVTLYDDGTKDASLQAKDVNNPATTARVCFRGDSLQTLGEEFDAFAPSLRSALNQIEGPDAQQIVKEANQGLAEVKANPELLLNEQRLDETFASTQAAVEDAGLSWC